MNSLKPNEKRLLMVMGIVVIVAVWLVMSPAGGSTARLLPAAVARQRYRTAIQDKGRLDDETKRLKPKLEGMMQEGETDEVLPRMIQKLQQVAKQDGLHLREVKPLRAKRAGTVTKLPVSVRFSTEFRKAIPFIYHIEDPEAKLVIEKLNVSAPDEKSTLVDIEVQVACYAKTPAAELAKDNAGKTLAKPKTQSATL